MQSKEDGRELPTEAHHDVINAIACLTHCGRGDVRKGSAREAGPCSVYWRQWSSNQCSKESLQRLVSHAKVCAEPT